MEIGTFTGYSALAVAKALPPGGRLLCCDISEEWTAIAREHWERAGVSRPHRPSHRSGPRHPASPANRSPQVDLAFIDADKAGYIDYYDRVGPPSVGARSDPGGQRALARAMSPTRTRTDSTTEQIRAFNAHVLTDERVLVSLLPVGDGLSFIARRPT